MIWVKAFHIIAMVAWFAGLFYLPRLFVYHADAVDRISLDRFNVMERRLYYGITWPAGILTTLLGLILIYANPTYYWHAGWFHAKLGLVGVLWGFHFSCGHYLKQFKRETNQRSSRFFRVFNELPTLLLIGIVCLVVLK